MAEDDDKRHNAAEGESSEGGQPAGWEVPPPPTQSEQQPRQSIKPPVKALDRRHWAAKIGISFNTLKSEGFKKLYPFESRLQDVKGHSFHYLDEGQGEPVVMVHGNPTWSFYYRNLVIGLRDTHRCLVPDHLGCGFSEKPQKYAYNLENHIINFETWLEATLPPPSWNGGKINMIVHDWGGPIGIGYACRHPERIKRLIVLNSSVFTAGVMPLRIRVCRIPYLGAFLVKGLNLFASFATEMTTVKQMPYRVKKYYPLPYNSWKNRIGVYQFIRDIPLELGSPTRRLFRKMEDCLKELEDKPMLIQWGMKDWCFTPEFLKLWEKRFPKAEVDKYKAGHYVLEDAGEQILEKVKIFLRRPVL